MTKKFVLAISAVLVFLIGCGGKKENMTGDELRRYLNDKDNGLVKDELVNGIKVRLQYQPSSLLVQQELAQIQAKSNQVVDSLERKYSSAYYFIMKLSKDGKEAIRQLGSFNRYSDMVSVLSFEMARFVNLTTPERDTIPLSDYLFEQTYGISDGNSLLLSFKKVKLRDSKVIDINLAECGLGTGNLKFSFDKDDLEQVPKLNYTDK